MSVSSARCHLKSPARSISSLHPFEICLHYRDEFIQISVIPHTECCPQLIYSEGEGVLW